MALPVWGNLAKSQIDAETIEEAIARLIQAHEDDPNAHIEAGESLQSHKAAEIIDHVIDSIIDDKIRNFSVSFKKFSGNTAFYTCFFESLDGFQSGGVGAPNVEAQIGGARVETGLFINNTAYLSAEYVPPKGLKPNFDNFPTMQVRFRSDKKTDTLYHIHTGRNQPQVAGNDYIGWRFAANTLYAVCSSTVTGQETAVEIAGIDISDNHVYRFIFSAPGSVEFYIDEVLKTTIATNIPVGQFQDSSFYAYAKNVDGVNIARLFISHIIYDELAG